MESTGRGAMRALGTDQHTTWRESNPPNRVVKRVEDLLALRLLKIPQHELALSCTNGDDRAHGCEGHIVDATSHADTCPLHCCWQSVAYVVMGQRHLGWGVRKQGLKCRALITWFWLPCATRQDLDDLYAPDQGQDEHKCPQSKPLLIGREHVHQHGGFVRGHERGARASITAHENR